MAGRRHRANQMPELWENVVRGITAMTTPKTTDELARRSKHPRTDDVVAKALATEGEPLTEDLLFHARQLETELRELVADKDRLDWFQGNADRFKLECDLASDWPFWFTRYSALFQKDEAVSKGETLRQAIDQAMKGK